MENQHRRLHVQLSADLHRKLKMLAAGSKKTMSGIITELIKKEVQGIGELENEYSEKAINKNEQTQRAY